MEKARILIVEDEAIIAMEVESQLQSLGYEVTSIVDTGEKAIEKAEVDKPDLILMDIRIKGEMDGIDAAEAIRSQFGIPVIFSTAYLDEKRIDRAKITMPFGYVLKPIQERDLRVTIEMALYVSKVDKERKKTEEELKQNEDKLNKMFKFADYMVCIADLKTERFTKISPAFSRHLGWSEKEMLSKPILDFIHPDDVKKTESIIKEQMEKEVDVIQFENRYKTKDGDFRWFEWAAIPVPAEGITYSAAYDITERKQIEDALKKSEEWFSTTLKSIGDAVIATDTKGNVTMMNPVAESLTGWSQKDAKGKPLKEIFNIINEETREQVENPVEKVIKDGKIVGLANHTILIAKDTKEFPIDDSASPIRNNIGEITGVVLVFRDITERKQAEEELQKAHIVLEQRVEERTSELGIINNQLQQELRDHQQTETKLKESEERFRDLFENAPLPYQSLDENGQIIEVNEAWLVELGYRKNEVIGKNIIEFLPDDFHSVFYDRFPLFKKNGYILNANFKLKCKDGTIKETSFNGKIGRDDSGNFKQTHCVFAPINK